MLWSDVTPPDRQGGDTQETKGNENTEAQRGNKERRLQITTLSLLFIFIKTAIMIIIPDTLLNKD